jgi:putative spermidine/putrescine transport system ATP-binding protein
MLELVNVQKTLGDFHLRVSLAVENGRTLALTGPSGCGKTTLLHIIAGLVMPECGTVSLDGRVLDDASVHVPAWKRNAALVFQDAALFPNMNVEKNIGYGLAVRGTPQKARRERVARMLELVQLAGFEKRSVDALSGGERQRVAIARALAVEPACLLFDEPFSGLDEALRSETRSRLLEIRRFSSAPWVFVTHDKGEAAIVGDAIVNMEARKEEEK